MKDIRFYCEKCGSKVKARDKICKSCGSFFFQVRCPVCSYQAEVNDFKEGCPGCGYSGNNTSATDTGQKAGLIEVDNPFDADLETKSPSLSPGQRRKNADSTALIVALVIVAVAVIGCVLYYQLIIWGGR